MTLVILVISRNHPCIHRGSNRDACEGAISTDWQVLRLRGDSPLAIPPLTDRRIYDDRIR